ncbi:hypothetical protein [Sedimenticola hydrogenitrophicus]|uniref:hypothetical protein n=1 Tax=Sedimenticola hydrogenitrophicus TaxID=2967975 RepID=UPI0023AED6DA|nr:hypothetical protein [Sedimenticola hydrogenitrophicus]
MTCPLCGKSGDWAPRHTVCPDCVNRLKLDDPREELDTPPYTVVLAEQIRGAIGEFVPLPSQEHLEHIITEVLFEAANAIRAGHEIELEYLGRFGVRSVCQQPFITYQAAEYLLPRPANLEESA